MLRLVISGYLGDLVFQDTRRYIKWEMIAWHHQGLLLFSIWCTPPPSLPLFWPTSLNAKTHTRLYTGTSTYHIISYHIILYHITHHHIWPKLIIKYTHSAQSVFHKKTRKTKTVSGDFFANSKVNSSPSACDFDAWSPTCAMYRPPWSLTYPRHPNTSWEGVLAMYFWGPNTFSGGVWMSRDGHRKMVIGRLLSEKLGAMFGFMGGASLKFNMEPKNGRVQGDPGIWKASTFLGSMRIFRIYQSHPVTVANEGLEGIIKKMYIYINKFKEIYNNIYI